MQVQTKPEPYCPECGARMRLIRPKSHQHWNSFWGCTEYPTCDGSINIGPDGRPETDELDQTYNDRDIEPLTW